MKAIYKKIIEAYQPLLKIAKLNLPFKKSYEIFLLIKKIEEVIPFYQKEEIKLCEKYGGKSDELGFITFYSFEDKEKFLTEKNKLLKIEVEIPIDNFSLNINELNDLSISADEINALSYFIKIENKEE